MAVRTYGGGGGRNVDGSNGEGGPAGNAIVFF